MKRIATVILHLALYAVVAWFPAASAQEQGCRTASELVAEIKPSGLKTEPFEGAAFEKWLSAAIRKYGPPPSGKIPVSGIIVTGANPDIIILLLVLEDGTTCERITARNGAARTILKAARGISI